MKPQQGQSRRGIATFEFVLIIPFVLVLVAGIFVLGRAIVRKSTSATTARYKAWQKRPNAASGQPLRLAGSPLDSEVHFVKQERVPPGPLFRQANFQAESRNSTIARTWDYKDVPFKPGQGSMRVHRKELQMVLGNGGGGLVATGLEGFPLGLVPTNNPLLIPFNVVGPLGNFAVKAAALVLLGAKWAVIGAKFAFQMLRLAALFFHPRLARYYGRLANLMQLGVESIDNLNAASKGLPGNWPGNMSARIRNATP